MIEAPRSDVMTIAVSTSSAQSGVLDGSDICFVSNVECWVVFGSDPTATSSSLYVPDKTMVPFTNVKPGEKMAVIGSGAGTAYILQGQ